tara:strand:- start:12363 stop:13121 length:759 start_codon:yes stop_codon:yes gene_type:complete
MAQLKIRRTNKVGEQKIRGLTYIPHKQVCTLLNIKYGRLIKAVKEKLLPENAMPLEEYANSNGSRLYPKDAIVEVAMQDYKIDFLKKKISGGSGRSRRGGRSRSGGVNNDKKFHLSKRKCTLSHPPSGYLITGDFTDKWGLKRNTFHYLVGRLKKEDIPTSLLPVDDGFAYYWHPDFIKVVKKYRYVEELGTENTEEEVLEEKPAKVEFQSVKEGSKILLKYQDTEGNEFEQVLPLGASLMLSIEKSEEKEE